MSRTAAALRTAAIIGVVTLAWLAVASFLPNFHLGSTSIEARALFIGVVLILLLLILAAQLAMLRNWFASLLAQMPHRARGVRRLRALVLGAVLVGTLCGAAVLWYATQQWMPRMQQFLNSGRNAP